MRWTGWIGFCMAAALAAPAPGATRLKDLAGIEGVRDNQLIGYGLVVGLAGTGDRQMTLFSPQSLANMLERMGVSVPGATLIREKHRGGHDHRHAAAFRAAGHPPGRRWRRPSGRCQSAGRPADAHAPESAPTARFMP